MITINIQKSQKLTNYEYSLFVSFDYNSKIVDTIKELSERSYNVNTKEWEIPVKKLGYITERLTDFDFTINGYVAEKEELTELPDGFKFKTKPFKHQIAGVLYGLNHDKWLLADEQGLGKTKQIIDIAVEKKQTLGYKHCLIICGVNGLKWNWKNEIETHSDEQCRVLGQRRKRDGKLVVDSNKDKLADVQRIRHSAVTHQNALEEYFIVTNVETLRDDKIVAEIVKSTLSGDINMIAFDECHKAKDHTSQQGKGILKLKAETMIAMTGTPIMNNPLDLYMILRWLGYEGHSFGQFKTHYCLMGGFGGYEILGYKNMDELQERLGEIMLRRVKDEVLDLPEKTYVDEYVEMTAKQAQIYKEIKLEITANIDQIAMANNPLAELIRMRQATGYTGILSSVVRESAKLDRMEELVEEAVANKQQVVIFSNWTQITDEVYSRLCKKYKVSQITGNTKDADRQLIVEDYQNGKYNVLIGTIGAMGTGLTLTAGTVEIFMDEPWNDALKKQAEDRCHRIGQTKNITIYTLLCKDTIDERVHELVLKKGRIASAIVDGQINCNKSELLDFLLS